MTICKQKIGVAKHYELGGNSCCWSYLGGPRGDVELLELRVLLRLALIREDAVRIPAPELLQHGLRQTRESRSGPSGRTRDLEGVLARHPKGQTDTNPERAGAVVLTCCCRATCSRSLDACFRMASIGLRRRCWPPVRRGGRHRDREGRLVWRNGDGRGFGRWNGRGDLNRERGAYAYLFFC